MNIGIPLWAQNPRIGLVAIGKVDDGVLAFLREKLPLYFSGVKVEILEGIRLPKKCFDLRRGQFVGECVLSTLPSTPESKTLGIIDQDVYSEGLNFIFGLAGAAKTFIAIKRLRNEFYGLREDKDTFYLRVLKEANHELGHSFGLLHCPKARCVMHFSNSLLDTDVKGPGFCKKCSKSLESKLR
jgi:archaemetzincin